MQSLDTDSTRLLKHYTEILLLHQYVIYINFLKKKKKKSTEILTRNVFQAFNFGSSDCDISLYDSIDRPLCFPAETSESPSFSSLSPTVGSNDPNLIGRSIADPPNPTVPVSSSRWELVGSV